MIWHNLLWSRYKGRVFSALHTLAEQRGIDCFVVQIAESDDERAALSPVDLSYHNYPYKLLIDGPLGSVSKLRRYWRIVRETWASPADFTILTGYHLPEYWLQSLLLRLKNQRYGVFCDSTAYDNPRGGYKDLAKRIFFHFCDAIFCYGERSAQYVRSYGVPKDKVFIRCQAAALPPGYSEHAALQDRISAAAAPEKPRYLYVGRLSPEKSLDTLLRAFRLVLDHQPHAVLILVGRGPQEAELRALAADLGLGDSVSFLGAKFDDDLTREYARATCLVLPSRSEPWGLVVNEALSYGCPVVVSHRCGCVPELVREGTTGYKFQWGDHKQLSERLLQAHLAFRDVAATAENCFAAIRPYTPRAAAEAILDGCLVCTRGS